MTEKWSHDVPYALEYDMGPLRSLGFDDIQQLADLFQVNYGRVPSRYVSHKLQPTADDPQRQVFTVCHARFVPEEVRVHGHLLPLIRARHRVYGERETTLDFLKLRPPPALDASRRGR